MLRTLATLELERALLERVTCISEVSGDGDGTEGEGWHGRGEWRWYRFCLRVVRACVRASASIPLSHAVEWAVLRTLARVDVRSLMRCMEER